MPVILERRPVIEYREGPEGERGPRGKAGERGPEGRQGPPGRDGIDGVNGIDGKDGADAVVAPIVWAMVQIKRLANKQIEQAVIESDRGDVIVATPVYVDGLMASAALQRVE